MAGRREDLSMTLVYVLVSTKYYHKSAKMSVRMADSHSRSHAHKCSCYRGRCEERGGNRNSVRKVASCGSELADGCCCIGANEEGGRLAGEGLHTKYFSPRISGVLLDFAFAERVAGVQR